MMTEENLARLRQDYVVHREIVRCECLLVILIVSY